MQLLLREQGMLAMAFKIVDMMVRIYQRVEQSDDKNKHFAARLANVNASLFGPHTRARRVLERLASPGMCDDAEPGGVAYSAPCTHGAYSACRELQKCEKDDVANIGDMKTFRRGMADYLGELWALDHHIGRLVTAVDGAGARAPRALAACYPRGVHIPGVRVAVRTRSRRRRPPPGLRRSARFDDRRVHLRPWPRE